jgi:hypothetical protein
MTLTVPDYGKDAGYDDAGLYAPKPAISHALTAPYSSFKNDTSFEVNSGWISLPVTFNNGASAAQDHTVRIKLHHPQYYKIVDYAATRQSRPPMVPDIDNTDHGTLDPIATSADPHTGQQPPVLHDLSFAASCPLSTASGEVAKFSTAVRAKYSVAKEKLYLDSSDFNAGQDGWVMPPGYSSTPTKLQFRGKAPNDGNTKKVPMNVIPQYTFSSNTGPGFLEGAHGQLSEQQNTVTAVTTFFADAYDSTRYAQDPYRGQA